MSEAKLVKRIIDQFTAVGAKIVRTHSHQKRRRFESGAEPGTPDLIGVLMGRCILIEVKVDYNKPSEIQKKRHQEWRDAGALVIEARENFHIADLVETLRDAR